MDPRLDEAVRCARSGDPRAYRTIAELLGPALVRFLTSYLNGDAHAANDVAQETFVQALDAMEGIQDGLHLKRWCYRVAQCKAVDWIRRQAPRNRRLLSLDADPDVDLGAGRLRTHDPAPPDADGLRGRLRRAVRRLPPNYAGPLHLYYVQGYSTRETADLLGLGLSTVKMRLFRARAFLHREMRRDRQASRSGQGNRRSPAP